MRATKLNPDAKPFRRSADKVAAVEPKEPKAAPQKRAASGAVRPRKTATIKKQAKPTPVCQYFQAGNCKRGDKCKFLHSKPGDEDIAAVKAAAVPKPPSTSSLGLFDEDDDGDLPLVDGNSDSNSNSDAVAHSAPIWACPFCEEKMTQQDLGVHLAQTHNGEDSSQVCPICAVMPGGDPNYRSQDIFGHFALRHGGLRVAKPSKSSASFSPSMTYGGGPPSLRAPPKVMQTCHAVANGVSPLSRGLESLWEYSWRVDNKDCTPPEPCGQCEGSLSLAETRAILPCGCTFHLGCVQQKTAIPSCPKCELQNL